MNVNVVKGLVLGCVTSYVFCVSAKVEWLMWLFFLSTLLSPWCIIVMARGKGWGNDALHALVADLVFFQLLYCTILLNITWMTVFVAPPPYMRNDHLPVKGPCESHYPWSSRRWQGKGIERTDVRWQALCFLMSLSCLQGEDSQPPLLQRIHRATKVIRPLQRQTQALCFLLWEATYSLTDVLLEGEPTSCVQDNIQVTGV